MTKDEEINELREEIDELKNLIKNLSKSQTEAYKNLDAEEEEQTKKRLEQDIKRLNRDKRRMQKDSLHRDSLEEPKPPEPPEHLRDPMSPRRPRPPRAPRHESQPFFGEDFSFDFDSEEFKEKLKDLKKKVEKATRDGMKTAEKISEKMKKEFNKYLETETDKITRAVEITDEEYKEISRDIKHSRKDIDEAQKDVEIERKNVEEVRRAAASIRRRLERAYREKNLEQQVETERELKENDRDLRDAMKNLSDTRTMLAQVKREFARLQRRATKTHTARKHKGVRVVGPVDFDVDGTITEYVSKVANSVGKNLESTLRTAWGEGKKATRRVIKVGDDADIPTFLHANGRVSTKLLEEFYEEASELLSALGDKNRLMILKILESSPQYQKELSEDTGLKGGTFKHHTDILQDENFVTREAIRGRYLITQLGLEALKLSEVIYLRKKKLDEEFDQDNEDIDIDIE